MTDNPHSTAAKKKNQRISPVWWLPFIALLIVSYLGVKYFTSQGPLVTITFNTAEGLEVSKTKVKYKDVIIGKVESITLNHSEKDVKIAVRMNEDSETLLRQNSRFWVVKPRIGITQVSGLDTLFSGSYITIEPDKNVESPHRYEFEGLESPPIISQDEPGLKLTLLSSKAASLYPGTSIYYKGMSVGTVNRVYFSDDYLWVKADIFITAPHDKLIKDNTKFWSTSGFSVNAGADGIEVSVASFETLISGGITFETPISLVSEKHLPVANNAEYMLFANKKAAMTQNTGRKNYFVTYFNGSIKGLNVGAPVTLKGLTVGKVKDIRLLYDTQASTTRIPVLFEVYENRFSPVSATDTQDADELFQLPKQIISQGLHTQLEISNLLTGAKNIALINNNSESANTATLRNDPITGHTIIPSLPQSFDALTTGITNVIDKVNQLPLTEIANNLNVLLTSGKGLSKSATSTLASLNRLVDDLAVSTKTVLAGYSADTPLYYNLNQTLAQLSDTLSSVKAVTDMLARSPNALIFGEENPKESQPFYWGNDNDSN